MNRLHPRGVQCGQKTIRGSWRLGTSRVVQQEVGPRKRALQWHITQPNSLLGAGWSLFSRLLASFFEPIGICHGVSGFVCRTELGLAETVCGAICLSLSCVVHSLTLTLSGSVLPSWDQWTEALWPWQSPFRNRMPGFSCWNSLLCSEVISLESAQPQPSSCSISTALGAPCAESCVGRALGRQHVLAGLWWCHWRKASYGGVLIRTEETQFLQPPFVPPRY